MGKNGFLVFKYKICRLLKQITDMRKKISLFSFLLTFIVAKTAISYGQPIKETNFDWLKYARIFIIDGYNYPICPKLELNAEKLAETMVDMHANVLRIATSGHCGWMIPGTQFETSPYLGKRDILAECIDACKTRGIRVV